MQILTPQQIKIKNTVAEESSKRTMADLESKIREKLQELNNSVLEFEKAQKRQQLIIEENNLEILQLNDHISKLKSARKELMVPIDALKLHLEQEIADFRSKRAECVYRETEAKNIRDQFQDRLEQLTDKGQELDRKETNLEKKAQNIQFQENTLKKMTEDLSKRIEDHRIEIGLKSIEIQNAQYGIVQERHAIGVLNKELQNEKERLAIRDAEIQSRYATLLRTEERIK